MKYFSAALVALGGMGLIAFAVWTTKSAQPLWALLLMCWVLAAWAEQD